MTKLHMITFRCKSELFERMDAFAEARDIDRTSVLKLAVHYYLGAHRLAVKKKRSRGRKARKAKVARATTSTAEAV